MKKKYVKPQIDTVAFAANSSFCANCSGDDVTLLLDILTNGSSGMCFAAGESGCEIDGNALLNKAEVYCKFTHVENGTKVFLS